MKMSTLLMAMMLVVGAAGGSVNVSLNVIFDEISKLNRSATLDYFVEDLTHLAEGVNKCGDAFFCKVKDILLHQNFSRSVEEKKKLGKNLEEKKKPKKNAVMEGIVRNLKIYINHRNVSCSQVLKDVKTSNISTEAVQFWERIKYCIRYYNFQGRK